MLALQKDVVTQGVIGIWDLQTAPLTLGSLLIFLAEMAVIAQLHQAKKCSLCFLAGPGQSWRGARRFTPDELQELPLLSILEHFEGVEEYLRADTLSSLQVYIADQSDKSIVWPKPLPSSEGMFSYYVYDSTLRLQMAFLERGYIPILKMSPAILAWAREFTRQHAAGKIPIIMHLKNSSTTPGQSNANSAEWLTFLTQTAAIPDIVFILIGNEAVHDSIRHLPHVIISQDYGVTLAQDLALILTAGAFIGMSSGPCNMAIFSRTPYLIFKNPQQHEAAMTKELGRADQFSFAAPGQKFLRAQDTTSSITREFNWLLPYAREHYHHAQI